MKKKESNAKYLLGQLGELSSYLAGIPASLEVGGGRIYNIAAPNLIGQLNSIFS